MATPSASTWRGAPCRSTCARKNGGGTSASLCPSPRLSGPSLPSPRSAADSEAARARLEGCLILRYGSGPRQTVDLFPAAQPRGALLFIHGGYWRALDKSDHAFVAPPLVAQGIGVAVINYDLCPDV